VPVRATVSTAGGGLLSTGFQKMLLRCGANVHAALGFDLRETAYFTNLNPQAFIGLLTQMLAVRYFGNNYHYIMHVLSGLQRHGNIPLCIGSSLSPAEAKRYFPEFSPGDLKG
jgi:hypothetical protein